jgi:hypothetical protein
VGDYIQIYYTFSDTANVLNGNSGNGFSLVTGLYNSGGSAPTNGTSLWNTGLASGQTSAVTGGTQNWLGYSGNIALVPHLLKIPPFKLGRYKLGQII